MLFWIEITLLAFSILANPITKTPSLKDHKTPNNNIRLYGGYASNTLMRFVALGDVRREFHHTSIKGIDFSRTIKKNYKDYPLDMSLRLSMVRYNEMNYQKDHNQVNLFFMVHRKANYRRMPIRFFIGEGISLSENVPYVEGRETRRISGRDSRLMNYLNIGFDFRLSDLTGFENLNKIRFGIADSHRSGAFSKVKLFNNTSGGSNFITLFLEYDF